jgi:hypothetical protein
MPPRYGHQAHSAASSFRSLRLCDAEQLSGVVDNGVLLGERHLLELLGVRCGDLSAGDTGRGRLEVVKGVLAGEGHDLAGDAEAGEAGLHAQHVAGLLDRLDDGLDVEGLDRAQVDDFGLDAVFALQLLGGDERLADAARKGDDGEVLAGALDLGLAELGVVSTLGKWRGESWCLRG